jgi:hypothetical protein
MSSGQDPIPSKGCAFPGSDEQQETPGTGEEPALTPEAIARLREFFSLLDMWDEQQQQGHG